MNTRLIALNDRFIPALLRGWANGLKALTTSEIATAEMGMGDAIVAAYCADEITREEANEVWACWQELKADEMAYLGSSDKEVAAMRRAA